ncbi:MAG: hypothetical protein EA422_13120 [Gemmatimonadales bacterium]|nr:MAG: hypothetical protein EA422_13120 [Gemmatimonadales bacterium]
MELLSLLLSPLVLLALAAVYAVGSSLIRRRPAVRRRALVRFARRVDLPLPDAPLWAPVEAALTRRNVAVDLGAQIGIAAAAVVGLMLGHPGGRTGDIGAELGLWGMVVVGASVAGAATGSAWAGARDARRGAPAPGSRLARPTASVITDYVAPLELWSARLMAFAAAGALALGLVIATGVDTVAPAELLHIGTVLAAVVGPMALWLGVVTERRLLDLPQTAASTFELAWSDALRAQVLRDVVNAPLAIGVSTGFALLMAASFGVGDPTIANGLLGLLGAGVLGLAVVGIASSASKPQRHFRQRLWPRDGASYPGVGSDRPAGGSH